MTQSVFSSHVVSLFALVHPHCSCFPIRRLCCLAARGYFTPLSLSTLLYNIYRAHIQGFLSLFRFSPREALRITATYLTKKKEKTGGRPAWAYCPARPPELILFFTTPLFLHFSTRTFVFHFSCISELLPIFSLGLYVLACPQEHLLSYFDSYTLSPFLKFSWCDLHVSLSVL